MVKKIKKILFIILLLHIFQIFLNSQVLKSKGLVMQGWYNNKDLHYITLSAPHQNSLNLYKGSSLNKSEEKVDIGYGYKYKYETNEYESKWVYYSKNQVALGNSNLAEGQYGTEELLFHKTPLATYQNSNNCTGTNCYKYAETTSNYNFPDFNNINKLASAYLNISTKGILKSGIGDNANVTQVLTIKNAGNTLYRMTIAARSSYKKPTYVSERKIQSKYIETLKNNKTRIEGKDNAIYVSSQLKIGSSNILARTPKQFVNRLSWAEGTRGFGDEKALGSALNLYDNILLLPDDYTRELNVKHINIGQHNTVDESSESERQSRKDYHYEFTEYDSHRICKDEAYGTYIGYHMAKASSKDKAEEAVKVKINNSSVKTDTCAIISPSNEIEEQYVYLELYYKDDPSIIPPPSEPEVKTHVQVIHKIYDSDNNLTDTKYDEEIVLLSGSCTVYRSTKYGNYIGNTCRVDNYTHPSYGEHTNPDVSVTINAGSEEHGYYVYFAYQEPTYSVSNTSVIIRDIKYDYKGNYQSANMRGIKSSNTTIYIDNIIGYEGLGYLLSYDVDIPAYNAYVDNTSYTINIANIKKEIVYLNFIYKEKDAEKKDAIIEPTIVGNLGIKAEQALFSVYWENNKADFGKYTSKDILSVPSGEKIDLGMEDLKKHYIGGIRTENTEKKDREITKSLTRETIVEVYEIDSTDNLIPHGYESTSNTFNVIIPYKYMEYSVTDFSTYTLEKSDIYSPNGVGNKDTKGEKIIEPSTIKVPYKISDKIDIAVKKNIDDKIELSLKKVENTITISSHPISNLASDPINSLYLHPLEESKITSTASGYTETITVYTTDSDDPDDDDADINKNKNGVYVYKGLNKKNEAVYFIENVYSTTGYNGLAQSVLNSINSKRAINFKLELKTTENDSNINLDDGSSSHTIGNVAQAKNTLYIWDLNFGTTGSYKFPGYVNIFNEKNSMKINTLGKSYYTEGFGGDIGKLDNTLIGSSITSKITYETQKDDLIQKIDLKRINGRRAFSEETTYEPAKYKGNHTFEDNFYYSSARKSKEAIYFPFENKAQKQWHTYVLGTVDLVNVYTPIEIDNNVDIHAKEEQLNQLVDKSNLPADLLLNSKFSIKLGVGKYDSGGVYGKIDASELKKYCAGFYLNFSFDVEYVELKNIYGDIVKIKNLTKDTFHYFDLVKYPLSGTILEIFVKARKEISDTVYITARAAAVNLHTKKIIEQQSKLYNYERFFKYYYNICNYEGASITAVDGPVYYDEVKWELNPIHISRLYDFRITDVKDVSWKKVFRDSNSSSDHNEVAYYTGFRKWEEKKGLVARTDSEIGKYLNRTLPIGPYKHTDKTYVAAPKIGYRIAFDIKRTSPVPPTTAVNYEQLSYNENHDVIIEPKFFYLSKDGTKFNDNISVYYKNNNGKYVKIGSKDDQYKIFFTPNEKGRLLEYDIGELLYLSSKTVELGSLTKLILKHDTCTTKHLTHQTFYGEYKLPNSTIAVKAGNELDNKNTLTDGYLGVIFKITSSFVFEGEPNNRVLSYQTDMDKNKNHTNQWKYEGYLGHAYGVDSVKQVVKLEKGKYTINSNTYKNIEGTVVLFDLDNRAATDFD